jgi:hypothetical protein
MSKPVQVFFVYYKKSELLSSVSGLAGFPSEANNPTIILSSSKLYDLQSDAVVVEYSICSSQIRSSVSGVTNSLAQTQFNIFDQLIIPNSTVGGVTINDTTYRAPKRITQDWFGRKVILSHAESVYPEKEVFEIHVYDEEL